MSISFLESAPRVNYVPSRQGSGSKSVVLELSQSRIYDYALNILDAYKLSGNFAIDLEIVLKDLGVFYDVTFAIGPKSFLSDCRYVEFFPKSRVHDARFSQIMQMIKGCVGYEPASSLWTRLFQTAQ
jgi:hypothetical protein